MSIKRYLSPKLSRPLREKTHPMDEAETLSVLIECLPQGVNRIMAKAADQGRVLREIGIIPLISAEVSVRGLGDLARIPGVIRIWEDTPVYAMLDQVVPGLGAGRAHQLGGTGKGIVVAVLDTGIFPHDDLVTPENRILAWRDLMQNRKEPYDDNGHGTHVAGIIAGNGRVSNGRYQGLAPEAKIVAVKILDEAGTGKLSDLIAGLEWCQKNLDLLNIKIINLSLGTMAQADAGRDLLCRCTTKLIQKGCAVVCSARDYCGFQGGTAPQANSPGLNPSVISVANYDGQITFAGDMIPENPETASLPGKPDLVAPGARITSLQAGGDYTTLSGASMAAPLVSGAIALILQKWPHMTPERVKRWLRKNARNLGVGAHLQGAGMLDLENLFGRNRRDPLKAASAPGFNDELLKALLNLAGANVSGPGPGNEFLINMLMSLMKHLKL